MRAHAKVIGVIALFAPSLALAQPAPISASQVLGDVQKANASATNIAAEFEQDVVNTTFGTTKHSKGKVFFAKPNLFRFDYPIAKPTATTPFQKAFIYDGTDLWYLDPPGLKVTQMPVAANSMPAAVTFWNGGNLATQFTVSFATKSSPNAPAATPGKLVLELVPKTPSTYTRLYLVVDAKTSTVAQSVVLDSSGDTNTFTFSAVNLAATTKPTAFQFNPTTMPSTWQLQKIAPQAPAAAKPTPAAAKPTPGTSPKPSSTSAQCRDNPLAKGCD